MDPEVISPTKQSFHGRTYTLHKATGRYRTGAGKHVLHRDVYGETYGNIPRGWHVHHRDDDVHNNVLENLQAMAPLDHEAHHKTHGRAYVCGICGTPFRATALGRNALFCSPACRDKDQWAKLQADPERLAKHNAARQARRKRNRDAGRERDTS